MSNLTTLLVETISSKCIGDYNQEQIDAWVSSAKNKEHWDKFINTQFSLVAEIEDKPVGLGSLENGNHIYFLYVHKDYMGLGIASNIYEKLVEESLKHGCEHITADVSKTALPFFKSKGFKVLKENKNVLNDVVIVNYHMIHYCNVRQS